MRITTGLCSIVIVLIGLIRTESIWAAEGGYSNYIPGLYGDFGVALMPEPGYYLRTDLYHYMADADGELVIRGSQIRSEVELDITMLMFTGVKVFGFEVLGGRYAFGGFVPVTSTDISGVIDLDGNEFPFDDDLTDLGDIGIMPISLFWVLDDLYLNAYHSITMPTGSYDKDDNLNASLNYWSFDTSLAITYLDPETGHELSATAGYIYNTENEDTDYQSGSEFHFDYMLNQFFSETFAVGLHGFFYKQVSGDSGSGALLGDNKGEAAGIGPAVTWTSQPGKRPLICSAKWISEFHAENRLEGDHFYLNLTVPL